MRFDFKDKTVLVVGLGKSGIAAAEALLKQGAKVTVYDRKQEGEMEPTLVQFFKNQKADCCFGEHPADLTRFEFLVMSPGVPLDTPFVAKAAELGAKLISEVELAYLMSDCKYAAITGTNGKTTTTTLTGEIFQAAGRYSEIVGNVGVAVVSKAVVVPASAWMITECSSFQLETTHEFHPAVSAILNITPDHMNRHKTMENYAAAKARVFANQTESDYAVLNKDDPETWKLAAGCRAEVVPFSRKEELDFGAYVKDGVIVIRDKQGIVWEICKAEDLIIPGAHNLENALAAAAMAFFSGIGSDVIGKTLREFQGVEHRMEFVDEIDGVRFVNDSKGTNPDASIKALEAIDGGIVLIAGGYDKGSDYEELIGAFQGKVKAMMLLGKTAPKIQEAALKAGFTNITLCRNMEECVKKGFAAARPGDTVLLSPACASWDMYTCFEQRGEHFKECVNKLAE